MDKFELLKKLISIKSISGEEKEIADFLFDMLTFEGLDAKRISNNIIIQLKGKNSKNLLILNAHIDTVDYGDITSWKNDPFKAYQEGDKIYGLGSIDDKASIITMVETVRYFSNNKPNTDILLMLVEKEEVDGSGTQEVLKYLTEKGILEKYQSVAAIIGEPTNANSFKIGHKGNAFMKIQFEGDSAHGSRPDLVKVNALKSAAEFILRQDVINNDLKKTYLDELGVPTINITQITSNSLSANRVSDKCEILIDLRSNLKFKTEYFKYIKSVLPINAKIITGDEEIMVGYTAKSTRIVSLIKNNFVNISIDFADFATDMAFFSNLGIDAVVFGPGNPALIHKPNEYIDTNDMDKAVGMLINLIEKY